MLEMFRPDISLAIASGGDQPTTTTNCVERACRAEHRLNQLKEMRNCMFENRRKQGEQSGNRNKGQQGGQLQGQNKNSNKRKGNSQRLETLANRYPKRTTLLTRLARNVARTTSENADKGLQYVTSAVRRGTLLEDAPLRPQMITGRTGIKEHNSYLYRL